MEKHYALYWLNGDNFESVVIDTTGEKTQEQILCEINKYEVDSYGEVAYFLSEIEPIFLWR